MTDLSAPLDRYRDRVRPEWIDYNGHMNMGYYLVVFDFATDEFLDWVGLDEGHRRQHRVTTFCLEAHVTYHREVRSGDPLRFTTLSHSPLGGGAGEAGARSRLHRQAARHLENRVRARLRRRNRILLVGRRGPLRPPPTVTPGPRPPSRRTRPGLPRTRRDRRPRQGSRRPRT